MCCKEFSSVSFIKYKMEKKNFMAFRNAVARFFRLPSLIYSFFATAFPISLWNDANSIEIYEMRKIFFLFKDCHKACTQNFLAATERQNDGRKYFLCSHSRVKMTSDFSFSVNTRKTRLNQY
jgi:hypothetical protein